ncbi:MAG: heavy metal translocating P-type ATPase [Myxococcota bacterium]
MSATDARPSSRQASLTSGGPPGRSAHAPNETSEASGRRIDCDHCGLPVPPAWVRPANERQFCCHGCRTVYEVIHAAGFEAYYELRDARPNRAAEATDQRFDELDDPAFLEQHCTPRPDGWMATELYLEGIHCSACVWLVEKAMTREAGVGEARLNFARGRLSLVWHPETRKLSEVARRLARLGYPAHPARPGQDNRRDEERRLLVRLGVAGAVAGNVMLMAAALYSGWFSGMAIEHRDFFRFMSLVVSIPAVLYSGAPFFAGAWSGLRAGVLHMDLPISIGIGVGFMGGVVNTFRGTGDVYFDSVTALIFLLLVGRLLQLRQQRRASESSELLYALTPSWARRLDGRGESQRVALEAVQPGDRLEVWPTERIPTDGIVEQGRSSVDASLLSGESHPVSVRPDDEVLGGTTNLEAVLKIRVTKSVRASRVGQIANMVVEAGRSKAPLVQLADTVAGYFVGVVLMLALGTFALWSWLSPADAIDHAVALLIVSCPCALGLATPLAITAAIGKAARGGILVRSGTALENLGTLRNATLFFDKTGTLTHGRMHVCRFDGPDWVRPWVAAAERDSTHPVGRALRTAMEVPSLRYALLDARVESGGLDTKVDSGEHRKRIVVGHPRFVEERATGGSVFRRRTEAWAKEALTPVWIAVDGTVVAAAGLADELRPEAASSLADLQRLGFRVKVLSGDAPSVVEAVARRLGLDPAECEGGLTPEQKLQRVEVELRNGAVVMVGDGVNDAASLAAATVGIAVHGGAETCFAAADVFFQTPGIENVGDLVRGARRTRGTIRNNIVFSLIYNVLGATLAMTGSLNPLLAAVLMPVSSLVVVTNSFRFRFGRNPMEHSRGSSDPRSEGTWQSSTSSYPLQS